MSARPAGPPREAATARSRTARPSGCGPSTRALSRGWPARQPRARACPMRELALSLPQLGNRCLEISPIAQDDSDRVVSQRGVVGTGLASEQGTRGQQGIVRPGHSERQQLGRIGRPVACIRISRFHSDNARQVPTPNKGSGGSCDRSGRRTGRAAKASASTGRPDLVRHSRHDGWSRGSGSPSCRLGGPRRGATTTIATAPCWSAMRT